ncbi:DUF4189 domain-containing protein [Bacillus sp. NP157]|nr:DUF4189 domain-containing protein [Bacillus sp. NP157]
MKRTLQTRYILGALALLTSVAHAQCATGVDTGGSGCIPPDALPGANGANTNAPAGPAWMNKYGAVVIDTATSAIGVADNMDSPQAASSKAVAQCESFGGKSCDDRLPYSNQCVALSWGTGGYGLSRHTDEGTAESMANQGCSKHATGCKTVYHACSMPVRVR